MQNLAIRSRGDSDVLKRAAEVIEHAAWSELGFLNYTKAHRELYDEILEEYEDLQLCLVDLNTGYPVAAANCVPIPTMDLDKLPAEGWDWVVETAAAQHKTPSRMLGALAVSVPRVHRGKGYARVMIRALREMASQRGFAGVVTPVRPSVKHAHPHVPIGEYITWLDGGGRMFDPWLRSHVSVGGRIIKPCERSMVVEEHIAFWETWAGKRIESSGEYLIEGALVPISVNTDTQIGRYEEPNVWMTYAS